MDLRETVESCGPDISGSGYGPVAGSCEGDDETLGSIKRGKLLK